MNQPQTAQELLEQLGAGLPSGTLTEQPGTLANGYIDVHVDAQHAIEVGRRASSTGWSIGYTASNAFQLINGKDNVVLQVRTPLSAGSQALADTIVTWDARIEGGLPSVIPLVGRPWDRMPSGVTDLPRAFTNTLDADAVLPVEALQKAQNGQFGTQYASSDPVAQTLAVLLDDTARPGERLAFHLLNNLARHFIDQLESGTNLLDTARALSEQRRSVGIHARTRRPGITP